MTTGSVLLIVALQTAGFFLLYLLLGRRMQRRLDSADTVQKVKEELTSIMVELNRTTDQNIGVVEDKIQQLKELIATAEKRIALLSRESRKQSAGTEVYSRLAEQQLAQEKKPKPEQRREAGLQEEVIRLHREGFSPGVIAGHVGTTVGEVELIISVGRRKS